MSSRHRSLSPQPVEARDPAQVLELFESAWQRGTPPEFPSFLSMLPATGPSRREVLLGLIRLDLEYRWRSFGVPTNSVSPPLLEAYLEKLPDVGSVNDLPEDLIGEEYLIRHWLGDRPTHAEYLQRFPHQADNLRTALPRLDAELAEDFSASGEGAKQGPDPATSPQSITTTETGAIGSRPGVQELFDFLSREGLLSPGQLDDLSLDNRKTVFPDAHAAAYNLVRRQWLTEFQANLLLEGRGTELVVGPYLLVEKLGEGGTGTVYKARHRNMQRDVALKIIRKALLADPDVVSRFDREIRIVGKLDHPNIVHAYDAGPIGSAHCLAMEYVEGTDLARQVRESGPLPVSLACNLIAQAARGLQHAHEHGLVHRDIKPPNLIVGSSESRNMGAMPCPANRAILKILDLGLARLQRQHRAKFDCTAIEEDLTSLVTPQGSVMMGTPDFMAPEQALDFHAADIRADIYSLGCTLFYMLTGEPPFPGGTLAQKLLRHQIQAPPRLATFRADTPESIAAILNRMLAKQAADRFETPAELAEALGPWTNGTNEETASVPLCAPTPPQVSAVPARLPIAQLSPATVPGAVAARRRLGWPFASAALGAGAVLAILVGWLAFGDSPNPRPASRARVSEAKTKFVANPKSPGILFTDHFESGNLNRWKKPASHTWRIDLNSDGTGNVLTGGTFSPPEIDSTEAREDSALYCGDVSWTDYAIDTWVRFGAEHSPNKRFYGIILFARVRPSANYWFEYGVAGQGEGAGQPMIFLFKRMAGREVQLINKRDVPKPKAGQWQHIRFEVEGRTLRGQVDNSCVQVEDDSLTSGRVGLTLSNVSTGCAKIAWKDFRVQALPVDAAKLAK